MPLRLSRARLERMVRPPTGYCRLCERLACRMRTILDAGLERRPDVAAIYRAMMLGQKRGLNPGQRQLFLRSGTMHLFAINGLHIGVVALSVHALLALLRCPRAAASALVLAVLWLDVDTTGASPSAVRAFLMVAVLEAAPVLRLPSNPLAALAAAALAIVLARPLDLFGASFQMSYGVVAAIVTLGLPLADRLRERFPAFPGLPEGARNRWQRARAALRRHLLGALGVGGAAALAGRGRRRVLRGVRSGRDRGQPGRRAAGGARHRGGLPLPVGRPLRGAGREPFPERRRLGPPSRHPAAPPGALRVPGACFSAHFRAGWIGPAALGAFLAACLAGYAGGWSRARGGFWPPAAASPSRLFSAPNSALLSRDEKRLRTRHGAPRQVRPGRGPRLSPGQKARLAEIDRVYKGKIAEREIFLKQQLEKALADQNAEEIREDQEAAGERARPPGGGAGGGEGKGPQGGC